MNNIYLFIVLLFVISLRYFTRPFNTDSVSEGFKGGRRGGRRGRSGSRGRGMRRGRARGRSASLRRKHGGGRNRYRGYNNYGYRGYGGGYGYGGYGGYGGGYGGGYPWYSYLGLGSSPFSWGNPYGYGTRNAVNWFDFRNCPTGCVANSYSPSGYTCVGTGGYNSCVADSDCTGCNVPLVNSPVVSYY